MKIVSQLILGAMLAMFAAMPVAADDLTGADRFLCAPGEVTVCAMDGECTSGPPWEFNVPDFIEVDLEAGLLKTTEASEENRQTPITRIIREDGLIVLQGLEMGRAFSFNIEEATGTMTAVAARNGLFVGSFGVCTPLPVDGD
jgi:hypothetical protein